MNKNAILLLLIYEIIMNLLLEINVFYAFLKKTKKMSSTCHNSTGEFDKFLIRQGV